MAELCFASFTSDARRDGPRVPVDFVTAPGDLEPTSEHDLYVALVDDAMTYRMDGPEQADAWANCVVSLAQRFPLTGTGAHALLPVMLDASAFSLSADLQETSFVRADFGSESDRRDLLVMHIAVRLLQLVGDTEREASASNHEGAGVSLVPAAPIKFFLSHAKADLPGDDTRGPVNSLIALAGKGPVAHWYDAKNIAPGANFADTISSGITSSSMLIVVVGDAWSSREWCRRELLDAKAAGLPILVIDALEDRAQRLFPYLGNAPAVRWRSAAVASVAAEFGDQEKLREWDREDAQRVIVAALIEAVRFATADASPNSDPSDTEIALSAAPEVLVLGSIPDGTNTVWYPDPPLGNEEVQLLQRSRPDLRFSTRLEAIAAEQTSGRRHDVAISLSDSNDVADFGASEQHLALLADDLVLYLLLAGSTIHYGGQLGHGALAKDAKIKGDPIDYVDRLFGLVRSYADLAVLAEAKLTPINNWVGWPIHLGPAYQREKLTAYGDVARLHRLGRPDHLEVGTSELDAGDDEFFLPVGAERSYAWAVSMTHLRQEMAASTTCRVVLGGRLAGYVGLLPGVVEEAIISLEAKTPLYVLGAFGGAARVIGDLLHGRTRDLAETWEPSHREAWEATEGQYKTYERPYRTFDGLSAQLTEMGSDGLGAALHNGLDDNENEELFESSDSLRIVELILLGLRRLG